MKEVVLFTFLSIVLIVASENFCIEGNGIGICGSYRVAGAIDSIIWNNKQFINAYDHGRELQIAVVNASGECYNPTEAGSMNDGVGLTTTSKLLGVNTSGNVYRTTTLPAFWLVPHQQDPPNGCFAVNLSPLSNYETSKALTIGVYEVANAIQYLISIKIPEHQPYLQVEAPTGYMPVDFNTFWNINLSNGQISPTTQGPGEDKDDPVIISTQDHQFAMGAFLLGAPLSYVHYARFYFPYGPEAGTSKWSVVWRAYSGVTAGQTISFETIVCLGNLTMVQNCLFAVAQKRGYIRCTDPRC